MRRCCGNGNYCEDGVCKAQHVLGSNTLCMMALRKQILRDSRRRDSVRNDHGGVVRWMVALRINLLIESLPDRLLSDMAHGAERVGRFLEEKCIDVEVVVLDESTRTSRMAADALGCDVAQIAKSIVFVNEGVVVVVISGDRRVDIKNLSRLLGHKVSIADADSVRRHTGYVIGGVPPFPHVKGVKVLPDCSLGRFEDVWTAAGTPNSVMKIDIDTLRNTIGQNFIDVSK